MRTGLGYDLHRLVRGKKLMMGGVHIPFKKGEYLEDRYGYGYDNYVFAGCSSLPLKARKKIRDTGYEGGF